MTHPKTSIGDVRYNAQTGRFEALVTFYEGEARTRVPAEFEASIDTDFDTAARGLWNAALRQTGKPIVLAARTAVHRDPAKTPKLAQRFFEHALPEFRNFWFRDRAA